VRPRLYGFVRLFTRHVAVLYESNRQVKSQAQPSLSASTARSKLIVTRYLCLGACKFSLVGGKQCASSHCISIEGQSNASPTVSRWADTIVNWGWVGLAWPSTNEVAPTRNRLARIVFTFGRWSPPSQMLNRALSLRVFFTL